MKETNLLAGKQQIVNLDVTTEDLLGGLLVELVDERQLVGLNELADVLLSELATLDVVAALVELLQENDTVGLDLELVEHGLLGRDAEHNRIDGLGDVLEGGGLGRVGRLEQTDHDDLVVLLEFLELGSGGERAGSRTGLLLQPGDDLVGRASARVVEWLLVDEELDGRVAANFETFGETRFSGRVHFAQTDLGTLFLERRGRFVVLGLQSLAVTAPWGI